MASKLKFSIRPFDPSSVSPTELKQIEKAYAAAKRKNAKMVPLKTKKMRGFTIQAPPEVAESLTNLLGKALESTLQEIVDHAAKEKKRRAKKRVTKQPRLPRAT